MMMKKCLLLLFALISLLLAGCASAEDAVGTESPALVERTAPEAAPTDATEGSVPSPLEAFMQMVPDARIYDALECDLDGDGVSDYMILYSSEELRCSCGLSVCVADSVYSSMDLSGDQGLRFASEATLDVVDDTAVLSVQLEDPGAGTLYLYTVECSIDKAEEFVNYTIGSEMIGTAPPAEAGPSTVKGYVWNPSSNRLQAYYRSPDECLPPLSTPAADTEPYVDPIVPSGDARAFVSYSPDSYTYDYTNNLFKIGAVRVDNSANMYSDAELTFTVFHSGSCGVTMTDGTGIGGEEDAIFAMAGAAFGTEVASQVNWSAGTTVRTNSTVPPGEIGSITGYVVGIYSVGTAAYSSLDPTTGERVYETVDIGALVPTTNAWNLVVEVPCS